MDTISGVICPECKHIMSVRVGDMKSKCSKCRTPVVISWPKEMLDGQDPVSKVQETVGGGEAG